MSWLAGAAAAGLIALVAGCGSPPPAATASPQACYQAALNAVRRHVTVHAVPAECAGLSRADVTEAVSRAIRSAIGPAPKAAERARAGRDSRYLAGMIPPVTATRPRPRGLAAATRPLRVPAGLAALLAWVLTAAAGAYLLAGRLRGQRPGQAGRPRLPVPVLHAAAAVAGLAVWISFLAAGRIALAWAAVGLTFLIAGLGMAALLTGSASGTGNPGSAETRGAPRVPVLMIAAHGMLATATILLVLLATIATG